MAFSKVNQYELAIMASTGLDSDNSKILLDNLASNGYHLLSDEDLQSMRQYTEGMEFHVAKLAEYYDWPPKEGQQPVDREADNSVEEDGGH